MNREMDDVREALDYGFRQNWQYAQELIERYKLKEIIPVTPDPGITGRRLQEIVEAAITQAREMQREEDCKAVCRWCLLGEPAEFISGDNTFPLWWHHVAAQPMVNAFETACHADSIRRAKEAK